MRCVTSRLAFSNARRCTAASTQACPSLSTLLLPAFFLVSLIHLAAISPHSTCCDAIAGRLSQYLRRRRLTGMWSEDPGCIFEGFMPFAGHSSIILSTHAMMDSNLVQLWRTPVLFSVSMHASANSLHVVAVF